MRDLGPRDRQKVRIIPWQRRILQNLLPKTDLLINATPSDLRGILPSLGRLPRRAVVSDLVYTPLWTPLLKEARRQRRTVHPGYRMLLHQGALSYELWTGDRADLRLMKKGLLDALK